MNLTYAQSILADVQLLQNTIISIGLIVLVVWTLARIIRPKRLSLVDTPARPNELGAPHAMVLIGLYAGLALAGNLLISRWLLGDPDEGSAEALQAALLTNTAVQLLLVPVILLIGAQAFRNGLRRGMGLSFRHWQFDSLRGVLAVLAAYPLCVGVYLLTHLLLPERFQKVHEIIRVVGNDSFAWPWQLLGAASAIIVAPLAEELMYRGIVQSALRREFRKPWPAILVTSAVFAGLHMNAPQNIPAVFILSIVLGYSYERTGRLWPSILAHALFNSLTILFTLIQ